MILNKNKGFTLIELVTVIVVLSILGIFTYSFIDNAIKSYVLVEKQSVLYADGTYIMERITRELSDATIVNTADSNTLTFTTAAHLAPLTPVRPATIVTFQKQGSDLIRISNGNTIIIGRNIVAFDVARSAAVDGVIAVELELNNPADASIPSFILRTRITPNNYPGGYGVTGRSFNGDYYEKIQ